MMHFIRAIYILLTFVATTSQLVAAQHKPAASLPPNACVSAIHHYVATAYTSTAMDLQIRISAYDAVKLFLNKAPTPGEGWHESNLYWEEAYAILYPEILHHMQAAMARESSYKKSTLPKLLDPELCSKYWALISTKHGKAALGISYSIDLKNWLKRLEQNTSATRRLQFWVDRTRREIEKEQLVFDSPAFRNNQVLYREAYRDILEFDKHVMTAAEQTGVAYTSQDAAQSREFGAQMFSLHKDKLADIVQRFRSSAK